MKSNRTCRLVINYSRLSKWHAHWLISFEASMHSACVRRTDAPAVKEVGSIANATELTWLLKRIPLKGRMM